MIVLDRKPWAYYNDFEPSSVAWLKELIKRGLIADGEVDGRSILEVQADDLLSFTQCHFFAGIGGWSYALRLAGWRDEWPVWTGSPPCQPFSSAGRQKGNQDERHLAPHFAELVSEGRPPILFGEQVASAAVFGKAASAAKRGVASAPEWAWLDDLSDRLEAACYAVGASDIPAAGIGAPHIRQRTFFGAVRMGDSSNYGHVRGNLGNETGAERATPSGEQFVFSNKRCWGNDSADDGTSVRLEHPTGERLEGATGKGLSRGKQRFASDCEFEWLADALYIGQSGQRVVGQSGNSEAEGDRKVYRTVDAGGCSRLAEAHGGNTCAEWQQRSGEQRQQQENGESRGMGDTSRAAGERDAGSILGTETQEHGARQSVYGSLPFGPEHAGAGVGEWTCPLDNPWRDADWLYCRDGKWRPVEPGTFPLAHGLPARVGRLRGYGNAIVPQAAATFIQAFCESLKEPSDPVGADTYERMFEDLLG